MIQDYLWTGVSTGISVPVDRIPDPILCFALERYASRICTNLFQISVTIRCALCNST